MSLSIRTSLTLCLLASSALSGLTGAAWAAETSADADNSGLEEIVVTSRKKQELLVEVPMNIAAVTAAEIDKRNLIDKQDVYRTIAGAASPRGQLILRGLVGANDSTPDTTSSFTDDIPFDFDELYDIERVEVLRGPQGTLYGSNAIGGTVRIITNKPKMNETEIFASLQTKTEKNVDGLEIRGNGGINLPLVDDKLAMRVTGGAAYEPGQIINAATGNQRYRREDWLRAQLLWQPAEDTSINFSYVHEGWYSEGYTYADRSQPEGYYEASLTPDENEPYGYLVDVTFKECEAGQERPQCLGSGTTVDSNPKYTVYELFDQWAKEQTNLGSVRLEQDNLFGFADLTYAGSYRRLTDSSLDNWSRLDADDLFHAWIINHDSYGYKRWTHELRLQNSNQDSPFDWTVGAFYDKVDYGNVPDLQFEYHGDGDRGKALALYWWGTDVGALGQELYGDPNKNYNINQIEAWDREFAAFGELSYTLEGDSFGKIEFTAGLRYYDLTNVYHAIESGVWVGDEPSETNDRHDENGTNKKFSINWMPEDNFAVFGVYSEGYRPGGTNMPFLPASCVDDPNAGAFSSSYTSDTIKNYEMGVKGLFLNRRVQVSSAVFNIDWSDVRASIYMPTCGFTYTANAATARTRGIEFESTTLLTDTLKLSFNASYTDAKMTSDVEAIGAEDGDDMTMVPKYNLYVALDKDITLFGKEGFVRADMSAYGKYKAHFNTRDEDIAPAYAIVNLSTAFDISENVRLSLYLNNVLNKNYVTYRQARSRSEGNSLAALYEYYGAERSLAVRLDFKF